MKRLLLITLTLSCVQKSDYQAAQKSAEEFITHMPNATSVSCTQADTDNDGYCTCTVFRKDGLDTLSIQCGCQPDGWFSTNVARGCKVTQPRIDIRSRSM